MKSSSITILTWVCQEFGIPMEDLIGRDRSDRVSIPRNIAMMLLRENGEKLKEIGRIFNNRHYSTILKNAKNIKKLLDVDYNTREKVRKLPIPTSESKPVIFNITGQQFSNTYDKQTRESESTSP